jgi:ligand-binding SRPBCC domain-containing protein
MFITYKVEIFPNIKTKWVTEITKIVDKEYFIDEQRVGPYLIWHHEHLFQKLSDNQVKMTDTVHFKIPLGILGKLAYVSFIKKKLIHIFQFRYDFIEKSFNKDSK